MKAGIWVIVLSASCILALSIGLRQSLGLYLTPISMDLGIGRETFALSMGLMNLIWGLGAPLAGALADRYGAGRVVAAAGVAYGCGLWVMTFGGSGDQLLLGGVLIGLGLSGAGFTVILGTVGRAVHPARRGAALGLVSVGGSIGQFVALPYTHVLINGTGWLTSLIVLSATALLITPLAFGIAGRRAGEMPTGSQSMSAAFREACGAKSFWLLNAGFTVCGFHLAFVAVHLPGYLSDKGFDPWLAASALTVVGIANIVGCYLCGWLGDRYPKKSVLSSLYLLRAGIFVGFVLVPVTPLSVLIFAALIGVTWLGTVPLTSGLVGVIFGTRYMSMVFGMVFLGHQIGGFLGAWIGGYAFDVLGSYDVMWIASIGLALLSALLHWPIRERPIASGASVAKAAA